jgi:hypothetical protein
VQWDWVVASGPPLGHFPSQACGEQKRPERRVGILHAASGATTSNVLPDNLMGSQRLQDTIQVAEKHNLVLIVFLYPGSQSLPKFRLHGSMGSRELVNIQEADLLPLWVNTGTVMVRVADANAANCAYNMTPADNTFSNTCPILINHQTGANTIVPATTAAIVAGLYIKSPPVTSFANINLAASIVQHPLPNCRLYYSQVTVDPQKSIDYVQRNRNKKVIYRSFVTNSYTNIAVGASFNALVNSGIIHPTGILICPFIGSVASSGFGDYQWKSPFDTCPATLSPLSLTNLQVGIGGQNVLNSTLNMTYEKFLEQVNLAEQLTSSDFGVSTGLISQAYWEQSKWYFVNVERGNIADKLQPRNINVSFNNNSNVPIDVIIFTFYSDQLTIDVETGIVTK